MIFNKNYISSDSFSHGCLIRVDGQDPPLVVFKEPDGWLVFLRDAKLYGPEPDKSRVLRFIQEYRPDDIVLAAA